MPGRTTSAGHKTINDTAVIATVDNNVVTQAQEDSSASSSEASSTTSSATITPPPSRTRERSLSVRSFSVPTDIHTMGTNPKEQRAAPNNQAASEESREQAKLENKTLSSLQTYFANPSNTLDEVIINSSAIFYIPLDPLLGKIAGILNLIKDDNTYSVVIPNSNENFTNACKLLQKAHAHLELEEGPNDVSDLERIEWALDIVINEERLKNKKGDYSDANTYELELAQLENVSAKNDKVYKLKLQLKQIQALRANGYHYHSEEYYKERLRKNRPVRAATPPTPASNTTPGELEHPHFKTLTRHEAQRILTAKLHTYVDNIKLTAYKIDEKATNDKIKETLAKLEEVKAWWDSVRLVKEFWFIRDEEEQDQNKARKEILKASLEEVKSDIFWQILFILFPTVSAAVLCGWSGADSLQDPDYNLTDAFIKIAGTAAGTTNGLNNLRSAYYIRTIKRSWENFRVSINPYHWFFRAGILISDDGEARKLSCLKNFKFNLEALKYGAGSALLVTVPFLALSPWCWLLMLYMIPSYILVNKFQSDSFLGNLFTKIKDKIFKSRDHWWEYITLNMKWALIFLIIGGFISPVMGYVIFGKFLAALAPYIGTSLGIIASTALLPLLLLVFGVVITTLAFLIYDGSQSPEIRGILWALGSVGVGMFVIGLVGLIMAGVGWQIVILILAAMIAVCTSIIAFKLLSNSAIKFQDNGNKFFEILRNSYARNPTATILLAFLSIPLFLGLAGLNALVYGALSVFGLEGTLPFLTLFNENNTGKFALGALFGFSIGLAVNSILTLLTILFKPLATTVLDFSPELKRLLFMFHDFNPVTSAIFSISLVPLVVVAISAIPLVLWSIIGLPYYLGLLLTNLVCAWLGYEAFKMLEGLKLQNWFENVIDPLSTFILKNTFKLVCEYSNVIFNGIFQKTFNMFKTHASFSAALEKNWVYAYYVAIPLNAIICTISAAVIHTTYTPTYLSVAFLYKTVTLIIDGLGKLFSDKKPSTTPMTASETGENAPQSQSTLSAWQKTKKSAETFCTYTPDKVYKSTTEFFTKRVNEAAPMPLHKQFACDIPC